MKAHISASHLTELSARSFRELLQAELGDRCARNPQYSLRAFALDLDTDHSTLSQLVRGRRRITEGTIQRLGAALNLNPSAIAAYTAREQLAPNHDESTLIEMQRLTEYASRVVTDWEHFAILELTRVESFVPDVRWIGRVLGITPDEVTLAVNRLIHLGMLEMRDPTSWIDTSGHTVASIDDYSRAAIERLFAKVGHLVSCAGRNHPDLPQDHSATTIAVDARSIADAIARLHAFRRELIGRLDAGEPRNAVYRLDIHLYPVTNLQSKGTNNGKPRDALADRDEDAR